MKRVLRKLFLLATVIFMILGGTGITAFAGTMPGIPVNGGTITVDDLDTGAGQTVKVYPIYYVDPSSTTGFTVFYDEFKQVTDTWTSGIPDKALSGEEVTSLALASASLTEAASQSAAPGSKSVTFTGLKAGAYLIIVTETTQGDAKTRYVYTPLIQSNYKIGDNGKLVEENVTAEAKKTVNEFKKEKVSADGSADNDFVAQNGDILTYKITATVPFDKTEFKVADSITGAEYFFAGDGARFEVQDTNDSASPITVAIPTPTGDDAHGYAFTLDLTSLLANNLRAGHIVTITYTAKVREALNIHNTATSTNANDKPSVDVYTGIAKITKTNQDGTAKLAGAKFALSKTNSDGNKVYARLKNVNGEIYATGKWSEIIPLKDSKDQSVTEGEFDLVTTGPDGTAAIKGLDTGTYTFEEIVAPDGYARNENGAEVTVSEDNAKKQIANEAVMKDTRLNALPSTGGRGTYVFTVCGLMIMIAAASLLIFSRKRHE